MCEQGLHRKHNLYTHDLVEMWQGRVCKHDQTLLCTGIGGRMADFLWNLLGYEGVVNNYGQKGVERGGGGHEIRYKMHKTVK